VCISPTCTMGVYGPASQGMHLIGIEFMHASHGHASHGRGSHRHVLVLVPYPDPFRQRHTPKSHATVGVYLTGMHLTSVHLMGGRLIGVCLIYESSLRAGPGWRESLYRHQGCFEASELWATRPSWSALRVVKSCRKTAQRPRCCSKLKQQLCI
jgi:hypothetical protein